MILPANHQCPRRWRLLEMAFQTKRRIPRDEHLLIHRAVGLMTGRATFLQRIVLEHERPELFCVTLAARFILRHQLCASADDRIALVWLMTIAATHLALDDRVMTWQVERR